MRLKSLALSLIAVLLATLLLFNNAPRGAFAGFTETPTPTLTATPGPSPTPTPTLPVTPGPSPTSPADSVGARLELLKATSTTQVQVGNLISYTLTLRNTGSGEAVNQWVTDQLPSTLTFVDAFSTQGGFTFDAATNTVTFNVGTVAAGQTITMVIQARVNSQAKGGDTIRNVGVVSGVLISNEVSLLIVPERLPDAGTAPFSFELTLMLALLALVLPSLLVLALRRRA
ncbi:MAG: DUF11 domain-containing protein [Anaerolineales bacterium]|nr:DUF11 domain-containing protein [Anaerolineales bacterium]